ncbi:hypothetical protein TUBRATIS_25210 [Tubulinosema ratisbonensis]|uniref:Uncharacterized protein n=1 Tax=Tubulinosema ratisbonensis TaxID=291195 RepID=A0A437AIQ2_9MICR|nr:hypothetical protein TUBRATIS_25210 [Tubulinosema ratisbonensis]
MNSLFTIYFLIIKNTNNTYNEQTKELKGELVEICKRLSNEKSLYTHPPLQKFIDLNLDYDFGILEEFEVLYYQIRESIRVNEQSMFSHNKIFVNNYNSLVKKVIANRIHDNHRNLLLFANIFINRNFNTHAVFGSFYYTLSYYNDENSDEIAAILCPEYFEKGLGIRICKYGNQDVHSIIEKVKDTIRKYFQISNDKYFVLIIKGAIAQNSDIFRQHGLRFLLYLCDIVFLSPKFKKLCILNPEASLLQDIFRREITSVNLFKKLHFLLTIIVSRCDCILSLLFTNVDYLQSKRFLPKYKIKILRNMQCSIGLFIYSFLDLYETAFNHHKLLTDLKIHSLSILKKKYKKD